MIEEAKVRPVNISPEQAFTWAVSGGVVAPIKPITSEDPCAT
jgi:uncharacterized membrane protein